MIDPKGPTKAGQPPTSLLSNTSATCYRGKARLWEISDQPAISKVLILKIAAKALSPQPKACINQGVCCSFWNNPTRNILGQIFNRYSPKINPANCESDLKSVRLPTHRLRTLRISPHLRVELLIFINYVLRQCS